MSGYEVVGAALETHARTLTQLAGELSAALGTAGGSGMTGNAYGQKGQNFATALDALARVGQDALRAGVEALQSAGTTMREIAEAYERGDADAAERFGAEEGDMA